VGKGPSPLVGFNNNVKHKGRIFHVQTEDSGVTRPHIVTHLFADGGRILKSTRTDYSEHLGRADMGTVVRGLMKEQHKAMFIALRDGQLDATIDGLLGPVVTITTATPSGERRDTPAAMSIPLSVGTRAATIPDPSGAPSTTSPRASKAEVAAPPRGAQTLTDLVLADLASSRSPNPPSISAKPPPKPVSRGATPALGSPSVPPQRSGTVPSMPAQRGTSPSLPAQRGTAASRYAAARPAAIFSPNQEQRSLFGGASISEQSLDEVILSYLAEDLEGTPDK
jgi:hypothetical protein